MADLFREQLARWSFDGVDFPGADVTTSYGHDSAKHQGYGQRGADIETTGPKPKVFKVKIPCVNGLRGWTGLTPFPDLYRRLTELFDTTPEGGLTHPTWGYVPVHVDDVEEMIDPKIRSGLTLQVTFTEQAGTAQVLDLSSGNTPAASMQDAAARADAALPDGMAPLSIADRVADHLAYMEAVSRTFVEAVSATADLVAFLHDAADDPAAAVVDAHPFRAALRDIEVAAQRYQEEYFDTPAERSVTVPDDMDIVEIAAMPEVYGDASKAKRLLEANTILDPSLVPAGTVLRVLD